MKRLTIIILALLCALPITIATYVDYCDSPNCNEHNNWCGCREEPEPKPEPTSSTGDKTSSGAKTNSVYVITHEDWRWNEGLICIEGFQRKYDYQYRDGVWHTIIFDYPEIKMRTCISIEVFNPGERYAYLRYGGMLGVAFNGYFA